MGHEKFKYLDLGCLTGIEGVFGQGTKGEAFLNRERQLRLGDRKGQRTEILRKSPLTEAGLVSERKVDFSRMAIPETHLEERKIGKYFDTESLLRLDYQIRWCRSVFIDYGWTDIEQHVSLWFESGEIHLSKRNPREDENELEPINLIDAILACGRLDNSPIWYAAKFLAHWRRLESLPEVGSPQYNEVTNKLATLREAMLLGETWSEARFITNSGKDAVLGRKQNKTLDKHRDTANRTRKEQAEIRRNAISELLSETNRTGGSLTNWLATQLWEIHGINISKRTIRTDLAKMRDQ